MTAADPDATVLRAPKIGAAPRRLDQAWSSLAAAQPSPSVGMHSPGNPAAFGADTRPGSKTGDRSMEGREVPPAIPPDVLRAAEERGYEAGSARGAEAAQREFGARLTRLDQLLLSIAQKRDDLLEVLEDDLVELTFEAVGLIAGDASVRRELVFETVRRLLATRSSTQTLTVRVAPGDLEFLTSDGGATSFSFGSQVQFEPDPEIRLGGCVIETAQGSLDARLELQLVKLRNALLEGRSRSITDESLKDRADITP